MGIELTKLGKGVAAVGAASGISAASAATATVLHPKQITAEQLSKNIGITELTQAMLLTAEQKHQDDVERTEALKAGNKEILDKLSKLSEGITIRNQIDENRFDNLLSRISKVLQEGNDNARLAHEENYKVQERIALALEFLQKLNSLAADINSIRWSAHHSQEAMKNLASVNIDIRNALEEIPAKLNGLNNKLNGLAILDKVSKQLEALNEIEADKLTNINNSNAISQKIAEVLERINSNVNSIKWVVDGNTYEISETLKKSNYSEVLKNISDNTKAFLDRLKATPSSSNEMKELVKEIRDIKESLPDALALKLSCTAKTIVDAFEHTEKESTRKESTRKESELELEELRKCLKEKNLE